MSNRRKLRSARKGVKKAEQNRAAGKTPLRDDGRRYNGYQCDPKGGCGGIYLTVDLDRGATPMFMPCLTTQGCEGMAVSLGYPKTPPPLKVPLLVEWYSPETLRGVPQQLAEHVRKGGLLRRPTTDAPAWVVERLGPTFLREGESHHQLTLIYGDPQDATDPAQEQGDHVHHSGEAGSSGEGADEALDGEGEAASADPDSGTPFRDRGRE